MRTSMTMDRLPMDLTQAPRHLSDTRRDDVTEALATMFRIALSNTRACGWRILKALHDSRQLQAKREIARHRHLIDQFRRPK